MKKLIYIIGLLLIIFTSCEDVVDFPLNETDVDLYVIDAQITNMDNIFVNLTKSLPVYDTTTNPGVSGAIVSITDNETPSNTLTLVEKPDSAGYYTVPSGIEYKGVAERIYTLSIQIEDEIITSTEKLHEVAPIDSIVIKPSKEEEKFLGIFINSQEPATDEPDFYKWDIYIDGKFLNDVEYILIAEDGDVDGNYVYNLEIFTDFHDVTNEDERVLKKNSEVMVKQLSTSEIVFDFYTMVLNQAFSGGLFSVPPANAPTNFNSNTDKKILGVFRAHDVSVSNTVLIDDSIENQLEK